MNAITEMMRLDPEWEHECCFPGNCYHRQRVNGIVRCESPAACDYYCGEQKVQVLRHLATKEGE